MAARFGIIEKVGGSALSFANQHRPHFVRKGQPPIYRSFERMTTEERAAARQRTAALFARVLGPQWRTHVASALDRDPAQVRRWFTPPKGRDDAPPVGIQATAELLAVTPRRLWPDRWTK